jgi:nucleoside-diphosphate-sugar epimerase
MKPGKDPEKSARMRVLVSGATGVIGLRVVPLLLSRGHSVTALVRKPSSRARLEQAGATCAAADLFDIEALKRVAEGHDAIINLATHMPSATWKMLFRAAWRENDRLRTQGVANLVEAALDTGVGTLIQESFALAYPDQGDDWIDESTPLEPANYNRTVLDAEQSVTRFTRKGGRGVVLRFAAFYGPDAMQLHGYIDSLRRGWAALPGDPFAYFSSISHDDAAAAAAAALAAPAGAYIVGDDEPVTRAVFFGSLANELGLPPPRYLPDWTIPLFGTVGRLMARSLRLSNRKLKKATGWMPRLRSVREGWPVALAEMGRT